MVLATVGLVLTLVALLVLWPGALEREVQHPVHPELFGRLFEGKVISEKVNPTRELVSRDIHTQAEEITQFEDCAGIENLDVGTLTLGSVSYSFLGGCCLQEGKNLTLHMGKLHRIHWVVRDLSLSDLEFFGQHPGESFPVAQLELFLGGTAVDIQSCETASHNLSDPTKGMALQCQSSQGTLNVKFHCKDFKTLDSSAYF